LKIEQRIFNENWVSPGKKLAIEVLTEYENINEIARKSQNAILKAMSALEQFQNQKSNTIKAIKVHCSKVKFWNL